MSNAHRTNVLVTSCLKTPVDPHTKAPLASYERQRALPTAAAAHMDNRDYEMEYEDPSSEFGDGDVEGKNSPLMVRDCFNLHKIFFSNEEYYSKLEELKRAHLHTMAELEGMYRKKLELKSMEPIEVTHEAGHRSPWAVSSPSAPRRLRRSCSAVELRRGPGELNSSDEEGAANSDVEKGLLSSPKEHIKNMWQGFKLSTLNRRRASCSSLHSLPGDDSPGHQHPNRTGQKRQRGKDTQQDQQPHRMTVSRPFQMTLREAEKQRRGVKTRSEIELENTELRRKLEELTECQRKFRANPVPAHVHLPLYEELQERDEERRRAARGREGHHLSTVQKPFSFLEREERKRERKEEQLRLQSSAQEKVKPFKAKPVPRAVYAAASGEQMKEEQLYRSIKMQMRAKEMLSSAATPPSMLVRRLSERKKTSDTEDGSGFSYSPKIKRHVPDFDATYRRFQTHLESRKEVRPVTACEPFQLRTSHISSHRERILADIEKDQTSPRMTRWPHLNSRPVCTPNSSLCSSLSGSLELLPAKVTDATKKRQEAVRKVLEQRRKAAEEEERRRERQKQRERKLQKLVLKRAQANDPHLALSQTNQAKLKEFRKQDLLRRKEYRQEIKEILERVKGRPLLLEQVAQQNAKQAAERRYVEALRGCGLTEDSVSSKVPKAHPPDSPGSSHKASVPCSSTPSKAEHDAGHTPVHHSKVQQDEEDVAADPEEQEGWRDKYELDAEAGEGEDVRRSADDDEYSDDCLDSDDSYHYSDDHENYSDNSEQDEDRGDGAGRRSHQSVS